MKETADGHTFALYSDGNGGPGAHAQASADAISDGSRAASAERVDAPRGHLRRDDPAAVTSTACRRPARPVTGATVDLDACRCASAATRVWGEHFAGVIDEVRIYYRALTAAEITADMNKPVR